MREIQINSERLAKSCDWNSKIRRKTAPSLQGQRCRCVQGKIRELPCPETRIRCRGDHGGVVRGKRPAREIYRHAGVPRALFERGPQLTVCGNSAGNNDARRAQFLRGGKRAFHQVPHHRVLEFAHKTERRRAAHRKKLLEFSFAALDGYFPRADFRRVFRMFPDVVQHGGLQAAEAEIIGIPADFDVPEMHRRGSVLPNCRQSVEDRAARIAQPQQFCHLVIRFTGRVIARLTQFAIRESSGGAVSRNLLRGLQLHFIQNRVPARDDQAHGRHRRRLPRFVRFEENRVHVPFEVIHRHKRLAERRCQRLAIRDSHEQRPDQPRALGHPDGINIPQLEPGVLQRLAHHGDNLPQMFARGELRDDSAVLPVNVELRSDHARQDFTAVGNHGRGRFIARGLDPQNSDAHFLQPLFFDNDASIVACCFKQTALPQETTRQKAVVNSRSLFQPKPMTTQAVNPGHNGPVKKVRKAVLPAAGMGTRFLPATKAQPKEMLNVVDKPQIQYVVEECVASGIEHIIIVTGKGKYSIEDHFDYNPTLERFLEEKGKQDQARMVRDISEMVQVSYTRQKEPLGLGHAVLVAKDLVGDEPFAVLLGDVLIPGENPATKQLIQVYEATGVGAIAVEEVPREKTHLYGIVDVEPAPQAPFGERLLRIRDLVEKPKPEKAPSNLAITGRYVLPSAIFNCLERTPPGAGNEIQLTDAMRILAREQGLWAYIYEGVSYDAGDKLGFLKATVELALQNKEFGAAFREYLKSLKL